MPRFFFDLLFDRYVVLDPGGMSLECAASAQAAADEMARHLVVSRAELRNSGSWIRVRDERRNKVYRSPIDLAGPKIARHDLRIGQTGEHRQNPNSSRIKKSVRDSRRPETCAPDIDPRIHRPHNASPSIWRDDDA
jgi:hypothetical protein